MTDIIDKRLAAAIQIILNPGQYKICEGCDSIVKEKTRICPSCHGYRFNFDIEDVIEQAQILGAREQQSVTKEDLF
jgi:hypothetical protein